MRADPVAARRRRPAGTGGRRSARCRPARARRPGVAAPAARPGPPAISDSLLASARRRPAAEGRQRDAQPGEADDAVDAHVGLVAQARPGPRRRARTSVPGGQPRRPRSAAPRRVGDGHHLRAAARGPGRPAASVDDHGAEGHDLEALGLGPDDVEGLGADRAGRAGEGDGRHGHGSPYPAAAGGTPAGGSAGRSR